ncbi:hypothetical protein CH063_13447 [Colletotrichum higginsianum]|uniref:Uncharacterized protein n=1 Tax=Colletotrichum higginsianum (strain IMI 349063) TaxID=759273 RepID=H1VUF1_COLHI|nr:hypothetical protein CH063_13447 [Colletotrichum higginsianum]
MRRKRREKKKRHETLGSASALKHDGRGRFEPGAGWTSVWDCFAGSRGGGRQQRQRYWSGGEQ